MPQLSAETSIQCTTCGGALARGPFGMRCAHCVLSLGASMAFTDENLVEDLFPELRLEGEIARGGFGVVYRAEHRRMKRPVALKFLDTLLARSPDAVALFEQEMITVGGLDHPGIVRAYDAGERDGHWYIIMELVEGRDCGSLARQHGRLPVVEACEIIRQAALALHQAHGQGLVHRDVKPGNIMISGDATSAEEATFGPGTSATSSVKILDFGLAGLAVAPVFNPAAMTSSSNLFLGTLEYTAPEQIESPSTVDARADIYSLGATFWKLITGKTPHPGSGEMSLFVHMKRITSERVPSILTERNDLPKPLAALCDQMLSLDRTKRPASAEEVARLFEPWCAGAELGTLFIAGPLEEKPFPTKVESSRAIKPYLVAAILASLAGLAVWKLTLNPKPRPVAPTASEVLGTSGRPIFSKQIREQRQLDEYTEPRLLSSGWVTEDVCTVSDPVQSARFMPDGSVLFISHGPKTVILRYDHAAKKQLTTFCEIESNYKPLFLSVSPESGFVAWGHTHDLLGRHLGRAAPDGKRLPLLRYDYTWQFPPLVYEAGRKALMANGKGVADGTPYGLSFVTSSNIPKNTGLRPGDVLVADEGHREFGFGIRSAPSLWAFRCDSEEPARTLGTDALLEFPLDVTVSTLGVFLLNRSETLPNLPEGSRDYNRRIFRWDQNGYHVCTSSKPIRDPSGIAADPLGNDLYVIEGALIPSASMSVQRVSRLKLTTPDHYDVEVIAERFGKFSLGGIAFSSDGQRMVLTDNGNRAIVILKRG